MDDKTFMAKYVAEETQRINERLKKLVTSNTPPSEEERQAVMEDVGNALSRLKRTLEQIEAEVAKEQMEEES